jgi:hypothetical protein
MFATGVVYTSGKFAASVVELLTPVANLPPVSTTLSKLVTKMLPVFLIPVVHLDLRISSQIVEKI